MKLSRQLFIIHSLIIALMVLGYTWMSLLNVRQLTLQELDSQASGAIQLLTAPLRQAITDDNQALIKTSIDHLYDTGNFIVIALVKEEIGQSEPVTIYQRQGNIEALDVPNWFITLLPLKPVAKTKVILPHSMDGIRLEVQTYPTAFYQFIWQQFIDIVFVTLFVGLIAWALGVALINIVLHPVLAVKRQAAAVARKHYPKIKSSSGIAEFEQLIEVHNEMTERLKVLFGQQQRHLTELKDQLYHDPVSKLPNRAYFTLTLRDLLIQEENRAPGCLVIIHVCDISKLKREQGFDSYQKVIKYIVNATDKEVGLNKNSTLFQLNEQDFALLLLHRSNNEVLTLAKQLAHNLEASPELQHNEGCHLGVTEIGEQDTSVSLMKRADAALKYAISHGQPLFMDNMDGNSDVMIAFSSKGELLKALETARVDFYTQSVVDATDQIVLFTELYSKLILNGHELTLASVLNMAEKFSVSSALDKKILSEFKKFYVQGAVKGRTSINISAFSLDSTSFQGWLFEFLEEAPGLALDLILEFDELDLDHSPMARDASFKLAKMGVEIAIDHFGRGSSSLSRFSDMKLHWLKIDSRFIHEETTNISKDYLTMVCDLVEKLGVYAVIPNIESQAQLMLAREVGCTGIQGYFIAAPQQLSES